MLVEGMIGAGKSTTAERIADSLRAEGEDARAFTEFATDHPIRTLAVDSLRATHPEPVARVPPATPDPDRWRRLGERPGTVVLEATFLQNSVLPAFLDCAPVPEVIELCARIEQQLTATRPLLVYLRPTDIAAAIERVHAERGEPWSSWNLASMTESPWARERHLTGVAALVEFWRAWEAVVDQLYDRYPFGKLMLLDPQLDREGALAAVLGTLRPPA